MTNRERALAVLRYQDYDRMPLVHFGFWEETIEKWRREGHIDDETAKNVYDGSENETKIAGMLGFDFNWSHTMGTNVDLLPAFEPELIETRPDGIQLVRNAYGVIELHKPGVVSIPAEVDHTLVDRKSWEQEFLPRLQFSKERIDFDAFLAVGDPAERENPLVYDCVKAALDTGAKFDYAHYWEDICFKNGPLVIPQVFHEKVGPHYKRINALLHQYGLDIISLDCDGLIDSLLPIWLENGVNTMFPIEVGTWNASIRPWREQYGRELRGVGGMNKTVFAYDYAAIDAEADRLVSLVELGGYIPCPDHRIAPDAKWENVQYYCEQMRKKLG